MRNPIPSTPPALLLLLLLTYSPWLPAATLTLAVAPGAAVFGTPVTLTATVAPPTVGKVTFYDGTTVLGTSTISAGTASLSTMMLPAGTRALRARYTGDGTTSNVIPYVVTTNPSVSFSTALARPDSCCGPIAAADFNGDGKVDLAMAAGDAIQIMLGNGDGTFQPAISHSLGAYPSAIAEGDLNGDGKPDLVVAFANGNNLRILTGAGDGTFADGAMYATGIFPFGIVVADFNGDGNADLAVANSNGKSVSILAGNGDGTFQVRVDYTISNFAYSLAAGDFNRDGKVDLVVGSAFGCAFTLLGNGDGSFQAPVLRLTGNQGAAVAVGDFNGDGNPDLAIVNTADNTVSILMGNGDGTFLPQVVYPVGSDSQAIILSDFDGDGKIDLAVPSDTGLRILAGNGNGTFHAAGTYPVSPRGGAYAASGDFNGDGKVDLALSMAYVHILIGNSSALTVFPAHTGDFYQGQNGTYTITVTNGQSAPTSGAVSVTDTLPAPLTLVSMTGSGWFCGGNTCTRNDVLAAGASYPAITVVASIPWSAWQVYNHVTVSGGGSPPVSADDPTMILGSAPAVPVLVSPANGATGVSLLPTMTWNAADGASSYLVVVQCGSSGFSATVPAYQTSFVDTVAALAEGTSCQWSVAATNPYGTTQSATWNFTVMGPSLAALPPTAALGTPVTLTFQAFPPGVAGRVAFYDGANLLGTKTLNGGTASLTTIQLPAGNRKITAYLLGDIPSHNIASNTITVPVNPRAVSTLGSRGQIPVWNGPRGLTTGDFNGDGKMDLAVAATANQSAPGAVSILLGNGDGSFQPAVNYFVGSGTYDVAVGDLNGDGKPDLVVTLFAPGLNSIAVLLGSGDGTFQSPVSYSAGAGPITVKVADLNQDGNADVVVADVASGVSVLLGNGNGTLQAAVPYATGAATECATVGDFNGDGKPDIAAVNASSNTVSVLIGKGDGTFLPAVNYGLPGSPNFVAAGDLNGDGALDLAVTIFGGQVQLLMGRGDGTFQSPASRQAGSYPTALSIADLDGDGKPDVAIANQDGTVVVLRGLGGGAFSNGQTIASGAYPWSLTAADFNGDGATDLAVTNGADNNVSILLGVAAITATAGTSQAVTVGTAFSAPLDARLTDAIGSPMSGISVNFSAPGSGPSAVLSAGGVTTNNLGVASVTATANTTSGSYSVIATVGNIATSFPLTNKPAAVTVSPAAQSTLVGTPFPQALRVTLRDSIGNALSGMAVNFVAPASGASAILSVGTANTDASGVASVTATANSIAGTYTVLVTVPLFGLSGSFQLANQAGTTLTLSAPGTAAFGAPVNLTAGITPAVATGKVSFYDGVTLLGTATLASGTASFSTIGLPVGLRKLTAFYPGDGVRLPATSNPAVTAVSAGATSGWSSAPAGPAPGYTNDMAVADLNRDGKADLVFANANGNMIGVLLGNGNGTFRAEIDYAVPGASWVGVADFNGDGIPDLAVSNSQNDAFSSSHFYVLLGNGDGTLRTPVPFVITGTVYPNALAIGDFNGDGKADLVFASSWENRVAVFLGNGDGTFQAAANYPATAANAIVVGDFNGDGRADLAVGSSTSLLHILLGNGDGTFRAAITYSTAHPAYYITAADFNGDGKLDVAIAEIGVNVAVFLGRGDGTLQSPLTFTTSSDVLRFTSTDMNGDGKPDLIFGLRNSAIAVQMGNGDGTFPAILSYPTACTIPTAVVPGEFNGDGRADLAVVAGCSTAGSVPPGNLNVFNLTIMTGIGGALRFVPMTPCRVVDTRNANGPLGGPILNAHSSRDFNIASSACGVPANAQAFSLNVGVAPSGPLGYLTLWPAAQVQPPVSTLNSLDGRIKSNAAIVWAGSGGNISVYATDSTHVILDINGYFIPATDPAALAFFPIAPCRLVDTRNKAGSLGGPSMTAGQTRTFPVLSAPCNLPVAARAYSLNFAVVPPGILGYLTAWPTGQSQPLAATLNDLTGTIVGNAAIVPAGTNGDINVFATAATDVVIDVNGYFAPMGTGGLSLYGVTPCRLLDTRQAAGSAPITQQDLAVADRGCGIPAAAKTDVLSVTVVPPGPLGFLTLWPQDQPRPLASTLNALDAAVTSNMALVPTNNGSISIFVSTPTHVVIDTSGYFAQ
jgi:uncharacterized repeat protein (TIGR01451 family)